MSSNGMWKVETGAQPTLIMSHDACFLASKLPCAPPQNMSQDEPIDFSQKTDSPCATAATQRQKTPNLDEGGFKSECNSVQHNGYPRNSVGYASLKHLYYVRDATELPGRFQNGSSDMGIKDRMVEPVQSVIPVQSPDSRTNCGRPDAEKQVSIYHRSIGSPDSLPRPGSCNVAIYHGSPSRHVADGTESSTSPDAHMSPLSSSDDNLASVKGSSEDNGQLMDVGNSEECPPETNGVPNGILPSIYFDACPSAETTKTNVPNSKLPSKYLETDQEMNRIKDHDALNTGGILARMLNEGNVRNRTEPPKLTIPITNPMLVRKTNGFSPGVANPLYHANFSPPVAAEEPLKTLPLVPIPNPWEVRSSPYDKKSPRSMRPFKAFGNDILNSCNPEILASMGLGGRPTNTVTFDKYIKFRSDYMQSSTSEMAREPSDAGADSTRPGSSSPESVRRLGNDSNDSSPRSPRIGNDDSQLQGSDNGGRRRGSRFPDNQKDPAYWERRRKNNEAAKRSRDARRRKEDALAMTAKELIEDKMRMTMHLTFQMKEMQKLEEENRFLKEREVTLQNYLFHLENRCRDCAKCSNRNSEKRPVVPNPM